MVGQNGCGCHTNYGYIEMKAHENVEGMELTEEQTGLMQVSCGYIRTSQVVTSDVWLLKRATELLKRISFI